MKVIQAGIGGVGDGWLRTVMASPEVSFAGFVEVDEAMAAKQAEKHGLDRALIFSSLAEALRAVSADAVIVCTPPQFHRDYSVAAMEAGLPVLSEKPLADTFEAGQDIVATSQRTGLLHAVSQNYRYRPVTQTVKRLLSSGELGRIGSVAVEYGLGTRFSGFRARMPYPVLIDGSIHFLDLMRFFLGAEPVSVIGRNWNPPWSWYQTPAAAGLVFEFDSGAMAMMHASWVIRETREKPTGHWRFECEYGVLTIQNEQITVDREGDEKPVQIPLVELERENRTYTLNEFYQAVRHGQPYATNCHDNIKSLAMVFRGIKACETATPVPFAR